MAAAAQALAARTAAETAYRFAHHSAEKRKNPGGGANINVRLLETALTKVQTKWEEFEVSQLNYHNKFVFADEEARQAAMEEWSEKETIHIDWVESVKTILGQIEVANTPPAPVCLTPAQIQARLQKQVSNQETALRKMADNLLVSLNDSTNTFTKPLLDHYGKECEQMLAELSGSLSNLYLRREEGDPDNWEVHNQEADEFSWDIKKKVLVIREKMAAKGTAGPSIGSNQDASSRAAIQSSYKEYKRDDLPTYGGSVREYPRFKKEWQTLVAPGRTQDWQLLNLEKRTPKEIDLSICVTLEEAWQMLDDKYACPTTVSSKLVQFYMDTKLKGKSDASKLVEINHNLVTLYNDLVAVNQEEQVTGNTFLLNTTIRWIPEKYQRELHMVRRMKKETPGETLWKILSRFLQDTVQDEQMYSPWHLEENTQKENPSKKLCFKCQSSNHESRNCPSSGARKKINALKIQDKAKFDRFKAETGACPICKAELHTWKKFGSGFDFVSNQLKDCPTFKDLATGQERAVKIAALKGCAMCTSFKHETSQCKLQMRPCKVDAGGKECGLKHHSLLHGNNVVGCNAVSVAKVSKVDMKEYDEFVMLHMVQYNFHGHISTIIFFDDGATCSIITHNLAKDLGLKGRKVTQFVETAGRGFEPLDTMMYSVSIRDNQGVKHKLSLMGMDRITTNPGKVDISVAYEKFPHIRVGDLDRPTGEVGMLIGQNHVALLPTGGAGVNCSGNLRVMDTIFGSGVVLGGSHPSLAAEGVQYTEEARTFCCARKIRGSQMNFLRKEPYLAFLEAEELATEIPRRCDRCAGCKRCSFESQELNKKEQEELRLLRENMTHDAENKCVRVSYPIIGDISKLRDNRYQVVKMAAGLERKLIKSGHLAAYNEQFQDYIERGVLVPITKQQIQEYKEQGGYINYIGHHGVEKESSTTTPLRIVSNSALKNCNTGPSVNDLWPKGPNSLSNLFDVFIRWRFYVIAVVWDIAKAYHSILTTITEKFLRLVVWRMGETEEDWQTWGFVRVAFGDLPASVLLELVKEIAAKAGAAIDEETAKKIFEDSYVDDNLSGGSPEQVEKMIGDCDEVDGKFVYNGTVSKILGLVGMTPKVIVRSGESDPRKLDKLGGRVLGHPWDAENDKLRFKLTVNLNEKRRGIRTGPDLTMETLHIVDGVNFTKRIILSMLNSFFDPTGMISAFLIKFKIMMREVSGNPDWDWDTELPRKFQEEWRVAVKEVVCAPEIVFSRGIRPMGAKGRAELIGYWDGSNLAYAAVVYIRWLVGGEESVGDRVWLVAFLTSKARVTPAAGLTTPRSELNGLVVLCRLIDRIMKCLDEKPCRVTMIGDSECTISAQESVTNSLAPYFSNRVNEAEDKMNSWGKKIETDKLEETSSEVMSFANDEVLIDKLYHTPGEINIADLATRDKAKIEDVGEGSEWQNGPRYLRESRTTWPVSREFMRNVPKEEKRMKYYEKINLLRDLCPIPVTKLSSLAKIMHYSDSWLKVKGIMARVIRVMIKRDSQTIRSQLTVEDYDKAERVMGCLAMEETVEMIGRDPKLGGGLALFWENGICWTRGRLGPSVKSLLGPDKLMILSCKSRLAKLIMIQCHGQDHRRDPGDTLFRSRSYAWIVRGRPLAEKVVKSCAWCNKEAKKTMNQQMGDYPKEKFDIPCRPFTNICVDYAGPYEVKAMNNARSKLKVYPVLFCCLNTGAISIKAAAGYGTANFLTQYEHHTAERGRPRFVYTDKGNNLVKAAEYVRESMELDWDNIIAKVAKEGTEWKLAPPGAQHRDGLAESRVKAVKKTLEHLTGGGDLRYDEYCCVLAQAANIVNERPLGIRHHSGAEGDLLPVTPNLLMLTRTDGGNYQEDKYENPDKYVRKQRHMEELMNQWWQLWYSQVFSSLFPLNKWKEQHKNLKAGDVCLVKYDRKVGKADYRLCRVKDVDHDTKGLVRTVRVLMRPRDKREKTLPYKSKNMITLELPVQRLVMICSAEEVEKEIARVSVDDEASASTSDHDKIPVDTNVAANVDTSEVDNVPAVESDGSDEERDLQERLNNLRK